MCLQSYLEPSSRVFLIVKSVTGVADVVVSMAIKVTISNEIFIPVGMFREMFIVFKPRLTLIR